MTLKQLQTRGYYWQSRLRLMDWDISFHFAGAMELNGAVGNCRRDDRNKSAIINICIESENTDKYTYNNNIEVTLVHELLHIHFSPLFKHSVDKFEDAAQEAAIELTAQALAGV